LQKANLLNFHAEISVHTAGTFLHCGPKYFLLLLNAPYLSIKNILRKKLKLWWFIALLLHCLRHLLFVRMDISLLKLTLWDLHLSWGKES